MENSIVQTDRVLDYVQYPEARFIGQIDMEIPGSTSSINSKLFSASGYLYDSSINFEDDPDWDECNIDWTPQ